MTESEFKTRTRDFSLSVIEFVDEVPRDRVGDHLARQLLRCGTSVGANYRSACRAKSTADMLAKLSIVEEEADEVPFWTDLLVASGRSSETRIASIDEEANQILAMVVASIKTLKSRSVRITGVRERLTAYDAQPNREAANPKLKIQNPK